jgi:hypothetical protein
METPPPLPKREPQTSDDTPVTVKEARQLKGMMGIIIAALVAIAVGIFVLLVFLSNVFAPPRMPSLGAIETKSLTTVKEKKIKVPPQPTRFVPGPSPRDGVYKLTETGNEALVVGSSWAFVGHGMPTFQTWGEALKSKKKYFNGKNYEWRTVDQGKRYVMAVTISDHGLWDDQGNLWGPVLYKLDNITKRVEGAYFDGVSDFMPIMRYQSGGPSRIWYRHEEETIYVATPDGKLKGKFVLDRSLDSMEQVERVRSYQGMMNNEIAKDRAAGRVDTNIRWLQQRDAEERRRIEAVRATER